MKLLTSILLVAFASTTVLASIDPQDITVQRDPTSQTLIVRTTIALDRAAAFTLTDADGRTIYTDSVGAGQFVNKRFPLNAFPQRDYELTISDRRGATTQPFRPHAQGGVTDRSQAQRLAYPRIDLRDERTLVVDYRNQSGKRVSIRLADQAGNTVFSDKVEGTAVQRSYRLTNLDRGDYQVTVNGRDLKDYTTAIALR